MNRTLFSLAFLMMLMEVIQANPFNSGQTRPVYRVENNQVTLSRVNFVNQVLYQNLFKSEPAFGLKSKNFSSLAVDTLGKPPSIAAKFMGQWLGGMTVGVFGGYVGAAIGGAFAPSSDGRGQIGYVLSGFGVGYSLVRSFIIFHIGNTDEYVGSYFYTFLTYSSSALAFAHYISNHVPGAFTIQGAFVLVDLAATVLATFSHYASMKPRKKMPASLQVIPTLLHAENQTLHAGLQVKVRF